jgi:DnaK suppressor protein
MNRKHERENRDPTRQERHAILKEMLETSRAEVLSRLRTLREAQPPAPDERDVDGLMDELAREIEWALVEAESHTVRSIENAIRHLDDGTYGVCGVCQADVSAARLRALPFAELCHRCQGELEATAPATRGADRRFGIPLMPTETR